MRRPWWRNRRAAPSSVPGGSLVAAGSSADPAAPALQSERHQARASHSQGAAASVAAQGAAETAIEAGTTGEAEPASASASQSQSTAARW